jgi:hypothetical protein
MNKKHLFVILERTFLCVLDYEEAPEGNKKIFAG